MMLAIFNEDKNFTLLDSVRKKTDFLELVKSELGLNNGWYIGNDNYLYNNTLANTLLNVRFL